MDYQRNFPPLPTRASRSRKIIINVGSRRSKLALIQTQNVIDKLTQFYLNNAGELEHLVGQQTPAAASHDAISLEFKIVPISTLGDEVLDKALPDIGSKSLFTKELEVALLARAIDFAVHSLKDLPTTLPQGCAIGAILKRDCPEDVIILKKQLASSLDPIELLKERRNDDDRFVVGTSSHRRISMVKKCNPTLQCADIRGNLNTRLAKLDDDRSQYSAIILARAGLDRMGWSDRSSKLLTPDNGVKDWFYAVGQGAIAVEIRADDERIMNLLSPISDLRTACETIAERALMKKVEGGCSVALGVRSSWIPSEAGCDLLLESIALAEDGSTDVKADGRAQVNRISSHARLEGGELRSMLTDLQVKNFDKKLTQTGMELNLTNCARLGIDVASKLIEKGCLEIMRPAKELISG